MASVGTWSHSGDFSSDCENRQIALCVYYAMWNKHVVKYHQVLVFNYLTKWLYQCYCVWFWSMGLRVSQGYWKCPCIEGVTQSSDMCCSWESVAGWLFMLCIYTIVLNTGFVLYNDSFDIYPTRIYNKLFKLDSIGRITLASKLQNIFLVREAFVKLCIEAVGLSVFITRYWGCRSVCISVRDNFKVACNTVGKLWPISAQEMQALYSIIIRFACQPSFMWEVFRSMNTDLLELVISNTTDRVTSSLKN